MATGCLRLGKGCAAVNGGDRCILSDGGPLQRFHQGYFGYPQVLLSSSKHTNEPLSALRLTCKNPEVPSKHPKHPEVPLVPPPPMRLHHSWHPSLDAGADALPRFPKALWHTSCSVLGCAQVRQLQLELEQLRQQQRRQQEQEERRQRKVRSVQRPEPKCSTTWWLHVLLVEYVCSA
jgi:hypothetical protein